MDTLTLFDDSSADTAPAAVPQSSAVKIKTYKIGINRGNGRIWLEGKLIESAGFACGIEYTRVDNRADGVITLYLGRLSGIDGLHFPVRRVTNGNKKGVARPVIELCDATIRERFAGFSRVEVEFHKPQPQSNYATCGRLVIRGAK